MDIRPAEEKDTDGIWEIFEIVIKSGDTYAFDPNTTKELFHQYWLANNMRTFVAIEEDKVLGTYFIKANQIGLGAHIANCGYMVHPNARGKGLGKKLCEHSLIKAKDMGYIGMQFNLVVSTNETAVKLWKKSGFKVIGTIPKGFSHSKLGYVDAFIMYREII